MRTLCSHASLDLHMRNIHMSKCAYPWVRLCVSSVTSHYVMAEHNHKANKAITVRAPTPLSRRYLHTAGKDVGRGSSDLRNGNLHRAFALVVILLILIVVCLIIVLCLIILSGVLFVLALAGLLLRLSAGIFWPLFWGYFRLRLRFRIRLRIQGKGKVIIVLTRSW